MEIVKAGVTQEEKDSKWILNSCSICHPLRIPRLEIPNLLPGEWSGEMAEQMGVSLANVSQHLRCLRQGVVDPARGTIYYRISNPKIAQAAT
jgi:hypothetical protein